VVYPEVPPRTEYSLTPLGETLRKPLGSLCEWAETHIGEVEKARVRSALPRYGRMALTRPASGWEK
jgi:DNA-binding HxlR family transcriptional regulator